MYVRMYVRTCMQCMCCTAFIYIRTYAHLFFIPHRLMLLKADMEVSGYVDAMRTLEEDEADIKLMKMKQYNERLAKEDQLMERFLLRKRNLER